MAQRAGGPEVMEVAEVGAAPLHVPPPHLPQHHLHQQQQLPGGLCVGVVCRALAGPVGSQ